MLVPALMIAVLAAKPAAEAPRPYDAQHYRIELRLGDDGAFQNETKITLLPARALPAVELDSFGLQIQKVTDEAGAEVPFTLAEDASKRTGTLTLKPARPLAPKKPVTFTVRYAGKAVEGQHEGFFKTVDPGNAALLPYYFTHFEPNGARRFFPCNDRPDDKATTELFAIVDGQYGVLSNGSKALDETFSEGGKNLRRVHWKQEQPHSPYLVAVAVGQFEPVEVSAGAPATLWLQPGDKERAFTGVDASEHAFRFQQRFLGVKYPWARYDQVSVPRFTWGGMENTSLIFMRENGLVLAHKNHIDGRTRISGLVAHELAHQWFGDLVTTRRWSEIWLNEGFATYLTWKTEDAYHESDLVEVRRVRGLFDGYFRAEDGPRSHPLVAKDQAPGEGFDSTSYTKGAQVLWMLEKWLGEERFRKGLKAYLERYALQNADSEDFFSTFMKATGTEKELRTFKDAWLHKRGYPVITPKTQWSGDTLTVTITQRPNHPDEKGHFVFKLPVVFHRQGTPSYQKEEVILVDRPQVTVKVQLPAAPQWVNWNKDFGALVRIDAPAISEQAWAAAVRGDPDPTWRTVALHHLLGTLVDKDAPKLTRPSDAAMDAITFALKEDASPYVREAALRWMAESKWRRLPDPFGPILFDLARRPTGLAEDALGVIRVRQAAAAALGKLEHRDGRAYLLAQVMQPELDLNYLPGIALGVANLGDSVALSTLRAAVRTSKGRGYAWYRSAAWTLGAVTTPEVVPVLEALVAENAGNNELVVDLIYTLDDNPAVKSSPELAAFVQRFVLESAAFGDDVKGRMLTLLDEVKTSAARNALSAVAGQSTSERLQRSAGKVLARNFPSAAPVQPAAQKGGPKKKKP